MIPIFALRESTELTVCYLEAARRLRDGEAMFGNWVYPPVLALPVVPLTWLPLVVARVSWIGIQAALVTALAWMTSQIVLPSSLDPSQRRTRLMAIVAAVIISFKHLISPLENQSHDLLVAVAVMAGILLGGRRREAWAGAALGAAAALKVMPILFLPVLLIQRRWRAALAMIGTGAALSLLPDLLFPIHSSPTQFERWVRLALHASDPSVAGGGLWPKWSLLSQNLSSLVTRMTTPTPPDVGLSFDVPLILLSPEMRRLAVAGAQALVLLLMGATVLAPRRHALTSRGEDLPFWRLVEGAAVACAMVLIAPHSSKYHFAVVSFAVLACAIDFVERRRDPLVGLLLGGLLALGLFTGRSVVGNTAADLMLAYGSVCLCAVLGLCACARVAWIRPGGGDELTGAQVRGRVGPALSTEPESS
jgi:hypothetical protein